MCYFFNLPPLYLVARWTRKICLPLRLDCLIIFGLSVSLQSSYHITYITFSPLIIATSPLPFLIPNGWTLPNTSVNPLCWFFAHHTPKTSKNSRPHNFSFFCSFSFTTAVTTMIACSSMYLLLSFPVFPYYPIISPLWDSEKISIKMKCSSNKHPISFASSILNRTIIKVPSWMIFMKIRYHTSGGGGTVHIFLASSSTLVHSSSSVRAYHHRHRITHPPVAVQTVQLYALSSYNGKRTCFCFALFSFSTKCGIWLWPERLLTIQSIKHHKEQPTGTACFFVPRRVEHVHSFCVFFVWRRKWSREQVQRS